MHGRMLLPSLFGLLLPITVGLPVRVPRVATAVASLVMAGWAIFALAGFRTTSALDLKTGIADERQIWLSYAHRAHPITAADYGRSRFAGDARDIRAIARTQRVVLIGPEGSSLGLPPLPLVPSIPARAVAARPSVGIIGYTTGSQVWIFDQLGLADPFGSRIRLRARGRPGHEKAIGAEWMVAMDAEPGAVTPAGGPSAALVTDARAALACPALRQLARAVSAPMDPGRFASNLWHAWSLTALRFDASPAVARAELCHGTG
jgi:arabinofuranosyltransferase